MTQAPATEPAAAAGQEGQVAVQEAQLAEVRDAGVRRGGSGKIDILLDTTVEVSATLGSVRMPVGQLLEMGTGSVIRLDRAAGEPVDLLLNGLAFAKGHLVVVDNHLGIRLTEVQTPETEEAEGGGPADTAS